ncbi:HD domain-containing protein [Bacillus glycinifermentans]|uniref:HD domain-containing protein n=1 Tax=Bacillus glycinifermentans TaxID=1664069 RepID=UPI002DB702AD|nr:HD domain-containing protein [Bacillus glycinifermentans]MEC0494282.1 HD domain-containing protein [Bacillus glycinifermentans]MEC0540697.1 HD domain-containing protein [Bacillus glycinifermentans]
MKINDRLYGEADVEPVLDELIRSGSVQRLKGVHQGGASFLVNPGWNVTRYEHSLGVMLLIRKLGGSLEEQIAGLLHAVSHTAFSHVIDDVFQMVNEDYHEQIFSGWVRHSDIPDILHTYGFSHEKLLYDDSKWTLLEQPAPALCADRIDYTLRDSLAYGFAEKDEIAEFIETGLTVFEGEICCTSISAAEWFTRLYYREVVDFFMHPLNLYGLKLVSKVLKQALEMRLITKDDILKTDDELIAVLNESHGLKGELKKLSTAKQRVKQGGPNDFTFHQTLKTRLIDPQVIQNGRKAPASSLSENVRQMTETAADAMEKGAYVKVSQ